MRVYFVPALFLHFCAVYPSRQQLFVERRWRTILLYLPAGILLPLASFIYLRDFLAGGIPILRQIPIVSESFVALFWKLSFFHFAVALIVSAALLVRTWVKAKSRGSSAAEMGCLGIALAITPFTILYGVSYLFWPRAIHG